MDKYNDVVIVSMDKKIIELEKTIKGMKPIMKPIKTWDEAQSEIQKQMGEIIKAVWDAGYTKGLKDGKEEK